MVSIQPRWNKRQRVYLMKLGTRFNFIYWISCIGVWLVCAFGLYRWGIIQYFYEDIFQHEKVWLGILYHLVLSLLVSSPSILSTAFVFTLITKSHLVKVFNKAFPVSNIKSRKIAFRIVRNEFRESPFSETILSALQPSASAPVEKGKAAVRLDKLAARYNIIEMILFFSSFILSAVILIAGFVLYVEARTPGCSSGIIETILFCLFGLFLLFPILALMGLFLKLFMPYLDRYAIGSFNRAFPVQNEEEQQKAIDILNDKFEKYSFAEVILNAHKEIYSQYFSRTEKVRREIKLMLSHRKLIYEQTDSAFGILILAVVAIGSTGLILFLIIKFFIPRFGESIGLLVGFLLALLMVPPYSFLEEVLLKHFSPDPRVKALKAFDRAFPPEKKEEREMSIDILNNEFGKYAFVKIIMKSLKIGPAKPK